VTFTAVTAEEMGRRLRLLDETGEPSLVGASAFVREAVFRWGLTRESAIRRWAADALVACGVERDFANEVSSDALERLVAIGDLEQVVLDAPPAAHGGEVDLGDVRARAGVHVAPTVPRLVHIAERVLLLGDVECEASVRDRGVGRWLDEAGAQQLIDGGIPEWGPLDWLGPPGWYAALERRESPERELTALWACIEESLAVGDPVSDPTALWIVGGRPGDFFGRHPPEGRWTALADAPDGAWCGVAPGYNERHWRPMAFEVSGGSYRSAPLWDMEELRWALISRGAAKGDPEVASWDGETLRLPFHAPAQLLRVRSLCDPDRWSWRAPRGLRVSELLSPLGVGLREEQRRGAT
jgi:hypothetical protein